MKQKKIKIAFVLNHMKIGGAQAMLSALLPQIDHDRFECHLFIFEKERTNKLVRQLDQYAIPYTFLGFSKNLIKNYLRFSSKLRIFKPNLIHANLDRRYSLIWCFVHKCPLILTIHSEPYRYFDATCLKLMQLVKLRKQLFFVGVSKKVSQAIPAVFPFDAKKIFTIYNPIVLPISEPSNQNTNDSSAIKVVCVARLEPVKNHKLLIDAFSSFLKNSPHSKLYLAGNGSLAKELQMQVKNLGITSNVFFLGEVDDIYCLLNQMDVFALSSTSEALGISVLEAMACGLPVIAPRVGGLPELVSDETGILFTPNQRQELTDALKLLSLDSAKREEMGNCGRKFAMQFSSVIIAKEYENLYGQLLDSN
ncbi:MAG: glycosyltransferase [Spirochaetia bacterium]|jgi:glycosyltransferase involved in cell wall biosynthesis|nr:glycosyltransferase [Spirochaetia bacterium]